MSRAVRTRWNTGCSIFRTVPCFHGPSPDRKRLEWHYQMPSNIPSTLQLRRNRQLVQVTVSKNEDTENSILNCYQRYWGCSNSTTVHMITPLSTSRSFKLLLETNAIPACVGVLIHLKVV
jgi:hypothetical protein